MGVTLIIIGAYLITSALRDTQQNVADLLHGDFTGQKSFIPWIVAILIVGAVGYIPTLQPISDAFLVLLLVVLFLSNGGFFEQFFKDIGVQQ